MSLIDRALHAAKSLAPESFKRKIKAAMGVPDMERSLLNMKRNGFRPRTIIDVGAYTGEWTRMCLRLFPEARVLMIEPQDRLREGLEKMARADGRLQFSPVLVGESAQTAVPFYEAETASSIFLESEKTKTATAMLPMTTIDDVTAGTEFQAADFIKLDVQGAELLALEGATRTLRATEAALMEVNLLEIYAGVPLFHETAAFMAERGFRVYDICSFMRRPLDGALWQADVIFVKASSPLVGSKKWGGQP
jgi:FkbM family methyltransferase